MPCCGLAPANAASARPNTAQCRPMLAWRPGRSKPGFMARLDSVCTSLLVPRRRSRGAAPGLLLLGTDRRGGREFSDPAPPDSSPKSMADDPLQCASASHLVLISSRRQVPCEWQLPVDQRVTARKAHLGRSVSWSTTGKAGECLRCKCRRPVPAAVGLPAFACLGVHPADCRRLRVWRWIMGRGLLRAVRRTNLLLASVAMGRRRCGQRRRVALQLISVSSDPSFSPRIRVSRVPFVVLRFIRCSLVRAAVPGLPAKRFTVVALADGADTVPPSAATNVMWAPGVGPIPRQPRTDRRPLATCPRPAPSYLPDPPRPFEGEIVLMIRTVLCF